MQRGKTVFVAATGNSPSQDKRIAVHFPAYIDDAIGVRGVVAKCSHEFNPRDTRNLVLTSPPYSLWAKPWEEFEYPIYAAPGIIAVATIVVLREPANAMARLQNDMSIPILAGQNQMYWHQYSLMSSNEKWRRTHFPYPQGIKGQCSFCKRSDCSPFGILLNDAKSSSPCKVQEVNRKNQAPIDP